MKTELRVYYKDILDEYFQAEVVSLFWKPSRK